MVQPIFSGPQTGALDFVIADFFYCCIVGNILKSHFLSIVAPGVRQDGVWWDLVEMAELECVDVEQTHS